MAQTTSAKQRPAQTKLAFHASRIIIDVGVLLTMAAMSLPFVTAAAGDRNSVDADALPVLLLLLPVFLITMIKGSILMGFATPSEAGAVGAFGVMVLALFNKRLTYSLVQDTCHTSAKTIAMIFFIIVSATCFAYVYRSLGGDDIVEHLIRDAGLTSWGLLILIMVAVSAPASRTSSARSDSKSWKYRPAIQLRRPSVAEIRRNSCERVFPELLNSEPLIGKGGLGSKYPKESVVDSKYPEMERSSAQRRS